MTQQQIKHLKKEAIDELTKMQIELSMKALRIIKYPKPKRLSTDWKRAFRIVALTFQIKAMANEKLIVSSIPSHKLGGIEYGEEMILNSDNKLIKL